MQTKPLTSPQIKDKRQRAIMDAIAQRIGYSTWRKLGNVLYKTVMNSDLNSDDDVLFAIYSEVYTMSMTTLNKMQSENHHHPARDILNILAEYPRQKRGRKSGKQVR